MPGRVSEFHEGESAMQKLLKIDLSENPTSLGLPTPYVYRVSASSLVAVATLDAEGRPWTTVWGGERGFAGLVAEDVLGFNTGVDTKYDPVLEAFWGGADREGTDVVQPNEGRGKMMSGLAIDPATRDRVKLGGNMVAGARTGTGVQIAMHVRESLGNCPKYINKKDITRHTPNPELVSDSLPLPQEALDLLNRADVFFMSSSDNRAMDTNIRGGARGFLRVLRNGEDAVELVYPEFSGNRLYQNLGNLRVNPAIGIVVPDFETSNALYLSGTASILLGEEASSLMARTKLALKITVTAARFVKSSLPFRGSFVEDSPYTPPVRYLLSEQDAHTGSNGSASSGIEAKLTGRENITPSINRFKFKLSSPSGPVPSWEAGQYISLDFSRELDSGYSHMKDDDPQSLNDDYIRTFTISSPPNSNSEIEITAKKNGPVTGFLWRYNLAAPLDVSVLGIGGEESFRLLKSPSPAVFVAGGVGITPVLAQAEGVLASGGDSSEPKLRLLWSLNAKDLALATDSFNRIKGLAETTTLFVSGNVDDEAAAAALKTVQQQGAKVERRRLGGGDLEGLKQKGNKFFLCTGPALLKNLGEWLKGEDVVYESFAY